MLIENDYEGEKIVDYTRQKEDRKVDELYYCK